MAARKTARGLLQLAQRGFASHAGRQGEIVGACSDAHRHLPGAVMQVRGRPRQACGLLRSPPEGTPERNQTLLRRSVGLSH